MTKIQLLGIYGVWMQGPGDEIERQRALGDGENDRAPLNCGDTFILRQLEARVDDETDL